MISIDFYWFPYFQPACWIARGDTSRYFTFLGTPHFIQGCFADVEVQAGLNPIFGALAQFVLEVNSNLSYYKLYPKCWQWFIVFADGLISQWTNKWSIINRRLSQRLAPRTRGISQRGTLLSLRWDRCGTGCPVPHRSGQVRRRFPIAVT